jgi:hypothetical protein
LIDEAAMLGAIVFRVKGGGHCMSLIYQKWIIKGTHRRGLLIREISDTKVYMDIPDENDGEGGKKGFQEGNGVVGFNLVDEAWSPCPKFDGWSHA